MWAHVSDISDVWADVPDICDVWADVLESCDVWADVPDIYNTLDDSRTSVTYVLMDQKVLTCRLMFPNICGVWADVPDLCDVWVDVPESTDVCCGLMFRASVPYGLMFRNL